MSKRILAFSDIHIHPHKKSSERLEDCLKALEWVFNTAVEHDIQDIVFAGDLFHDRQKIDVLTYQRTFEIFNKYLKSTSLKIFLLLGNHDLWHYQRWDISSVFPLAALNGVKVIDRPDTVKVAGKDISFLPYTHDPINDLKKITNKSDNRILFGHVAIDGALLNTMHGTQAEVGVEHDGEMIKVNSDIFQGWDGVYLGHYHAEQKLDYNVEYIGSPLQLSFGEAFQHKHVIILDLETNDKQYIRNTFSPTHLIIKESDVDKYDLNKNFIKIISEDITSPDVVKLRHKLVNDNALGSLEIKQAKRDVQDQIDIKDAKLVLLKEEEMIEKYIDEVEKQGKLGELNKSKLMDIAKLIKSKREVKKATPDE